MNAPIAHSSIKNNMTGTPRVPRDLAVTAPKAHQITIPSSVNMIITKAADAKSRPGPSENFTGTVWQAPIVEAPEPARIRAAWVSFTPGARTNWHTHPLGQTLHVVSGIGRIQLLGQPVREILPGDTIWIAPGEKHWHGAAPKNALVHLAMQESLDGSHATWLEPVSDEDYAATPA